MFSHGHSQTSMTSILVRSLWYRVDKSTACRNRVNKTNWRMRSWTAEEVKILFTCSSKPNTTLCASNRIEANKQRIVYNSVISPAQFSVCSFGFSSLPSFKEPFMGWRQRHGLSDLSPRALNEDSLQHKWIVSVDCESRQCCYQITNIN